MLFTRQVVGGIIVNSAIGLLYVWSLFLLPLEKSLLAGRSSLSVVPALALVFFTLGMMVHSRLLCSIRLSLYTGLAFGLCATGHAFYWFSGSLAALIIGYGILFGFGAGLAYGLALALAGCADEKVRGWAIGIVMAAFATSGMMLSILLAGPIARNDPASSFGIAAIALAFAGGAVALLLRGSIISVVHDDERRQTSLGAVQTGFSNLALVFFVMCFVGLMVMSHSTGMLQDMKASEGIRAAGPAVFTAGYVLGCLGGGKIAERFVERVVLGGGGVVMALGILLLLKAEAGLALGGISAIGAVFGSTASIMPVLISRRFGAARVGSIYGRLMIAYGFAGLCAPWLTGIAFDAQRSYQFAFLWALLLSLLAAVAGWFARPPHPK